VAFANAQLKAAKENLNRRQQRKQRRIRGWVSVIVIRRALDASSIVLIVFADSPNAVACRRSGGALPSGHRGKRAPCRHAELTDTLIRAPAFGPHP